MGKGKRLRYVRQAEQQAFTLSKSQEKAMRKEINAQILESDKQYWLDMDAAVMWALHEAFGFGRKRLRRFFDAFSTVHADLRKTYQIDGSITWKCRELLKSKVKVDVEAWEDEYEKMTATPSR